VTELVTGLDLVAWQIRVAAGEHLSESVLSSKPLGHAIEVRLYAEDPHRGFAPVSGTVTAWRMPEGPGVRVDTGVTGGTPLPLEYDPLLAKLLVHGEDRPAAVARLRRALDETAIGGVQTDLSFLRWLVDEPAFVTGTYDTGLIPNDWGDGPAMTDDEASLAGEIARLARARSASEPAVTAPAGTPGRTSAWQQAARREAVGRRRPG
jgi:acetyl/propionyl-CoA carboxylase alpha subunit